MLQKRSDTERKSKKITTENYFILKKNENYYKRIDTLTHLIYTHTRIY